MLQRFQCIVLSGTRLVEPRLIRERRVPIREIDETALLAALRHEDLHTASCARRQVLFDGLAFVGLRRRVNFRWRAAQLVELLDRRGQHFAVARGGNRPAETFPLLLCPQLDALDDAPAAHLKDLHGDPRGPALQAEDVAVSELGGRHLLLPIVERLHGAHRVAQLRRFFVPFTVGRGEHPRPQRLHELFVLAFEEQLRHVDRARVLVRGANSIHARGDAALDVVFEARAAAFAGDHLVARSDAEQTMRQRHGLAGETRRQERAGVEAAIALHAARDEDAREPFVRRQLQIRIILVVAEQDVVLRRPLFDQVVLERQRLDDRIGDDNLKAHDLVEQRIGLRIAAVGAKVVPDPVAERPRLADVNGVAIRVEVQIHSRLLRQPGNLLLEILDGHTLLCRDFVACLNPPL